MEKAIHLAGLIGPILIVLSVSEAVNLRIWKEMLPSVVYLNGLLLFIGGLAIVRAYHHWAFDWTAMIPLIGWSAMLTGLYRMFFPASPQLDVRPSTYAVLLLLLVMGLILSYKGYFE
jgi:hypothetical protein